VDYPPPAVRLDTRISDVATKLRTDVPFLRRLHFICIAAARVKQNTAGIWRGTSRRTSNARLKSADRAKARLLTIVKCHSAAVISRDPSLQNS
jgi:hypothetical protein